MEDLEQSFIGTGWSFPPTFHKEKRGVKMISNVEDINSSLEILFSTRLKERIMRPKYGCDLSDFLFEPVNLTLITYMKSIVKNAIVHYESRIKLLDLQLQSDQHEGVVTIELKYEIRGTNSRFNYVYPYYLEEGSEIRK